MAIYNNLQVNYDGSIFQYSKDPKDGFVEFTNSKGKVSYRKYFNKGVEGVLTSIKKENNQYLNGAEEIKLTLTDGEELNILSFMILNQGGDQLDEYAQSLVTLLPKMNKGETYNINNWFLKKGDNINGQEVRHNKKGITLKQDGTKIKSDVTFEYVKGRGTDQEEHVKGDVPMLQWKEIAGKNRPTAASKEIQLEFFYSMLENEITRISGEVSQESVPTTPKKEEVVKDNSPEEDYDLPF